jgi:hypothetical protein
MRADTRPYFIATTIINDLLSAAPRLSMLRNLFRLLAPPSAHTSYRHRTRAGVINYWRQGANVLPVPLPTTPSERTRENGPDLGAGPGAGQPSPAPPCGWVPSEQFFPKCRKWKKCGKRTKRLQVRKWQELRKRHKVQKLAPSH